ncbi:protein-tyrosine phosphatase [Mobilisporobacter senegalensis]|uniref:Protein-tyrosine phosphatase n=1 Tax=Mobilisporobacter senegalensis TaxID=1329262 RepID=A0A3N1XG59_9FIRM|nr:hypothetical protein [Mobilisporobacter senegalensis]ROR25700.1 protein-tyrosine phosphatase [Mobilisporobacter senegalensis]
MIKYDKIIFVCTSNTSRSVMAETIYKSLETNSDIEVISRGLVVLFPEPPNPKAVIVMDNHHLSIKDHTSILLRSEDITEDSLLLTMNNQQKEKLIEDFGFDLNAFTLKEFIGETGDVTDPYGKTLVEYEECYIELARLLKKAVYKLNKDVDKE